MDAVAIARAGFYPETATVDISPERLARFFAHEDLGFRVLPELSSSIVFTTHDVLADPPFSKLDMVSCRNLLIYLGREAQVKAISLFHFALGDGGILFLGNSESAGAIQGRFEIVSKSERLYRHIGRARPGELDFLMKNVESPRSLPRAGQSSAPTRLSDVAEYSRRLLIDNFAPAAALITRDGEVLYSLGPIDRYLRVAPGLPAQDVLAMARDDVRTKLRSAIQKACRENARVLVKSGRVSGKGGRPGFCIEVLPVQREGKDLLFVCFVDEPKSVSQAARTLKPGESYDDAALKQELAETRTELHDAILNLEESNEEQKAINEDALSVNEEFQSTNEELLTSKEELQSLNEELTALNTQLQETLERQRTTANDLQNVLYSTDVATLFLDAKLNIRFFTPATKALFNVIPSDVGRPLSDLKGLAVDVALLADAQTVLKTLTPIESEIQTHSGDYYSRRILPYRAQEEAVEGVVITFTNVTYRRRTANALEAAKRQAELANKAKSRFLAAASHDLRQPLQSMSLIQGFLQKHVVNETAKKYVKRLDGALDSMSGMLNTLLEINQIEAGTIEAEPVSFPINDILQRLRDEFEDHAAAKSLRLRVIPSTLILQSDPRLLEQMIRNLLANALKFTKTGKVLLGCRRHKGMARVEIWDSGIGIPATEWQAIFDEYHQIGNEAREASRGFGLGLAIVKRLGDMLGHPVRVHSRPGKGSAFAIEVVLAPVQSAPRVTISQSASDAEINGLDRSAHSILIVEDDPEMRDLLELILRDAGYGTATASDGFAALELVASGAIQPDIILSDYNLPLGMNGLEVAASLRDKLNRMVPLVILTGDISSWSLRKIALQGAQLRKPVKADELMKVIQEQLNLAAAGGRKM
jgi:two-component system CheB/CheR fusion protein